LADGLGYSLVLRNPGSNPDHSVPENWSASSRIGGSPGSPEGDGFTGNPAADDDGDGLSALIEYALGLDDTDSSQNGSVIQPSFVTLEGVDFVTLTFPLDPTASDAEVAIELSPDLQNWVSNPEAVELISSEPNESGQTIVTYRALDPVGAHEKLYLRLKVSLR
jgi:hypothetical protein